MSEKAQTTSTTKGAPIAARNEAALDRFARAVEAADDHEEHARKLLATARKQEKQAKLDAELRRVDAAWVYLKESPLRGNEAKYRKYGVQGPFIKDAADRVGHAPSTVRDWFERAFVKARLRKANIRALEKLCATSLGHLTRLRKREKALVAIAKEATSGEGLSSRQVKAKVEAALNKPGTTETDTPATAARTSPVAFVDGGRLAPVHRQRLHEVVIEIAADIPPAQRKAYLQSLLAQHIARLAADDFKNCEPSADLKPVHRALLSAFNEPNGQLPERARLSPLRARVGPRAWVTIHDDDGLELACDPGLAVRQLEALPAVVHTPTGVEAQRARVVAALEEAAAESWRSWDEAA